MTTPTPDVREIAEEAFYAGFAASGHRYDLSHDEEHELRVAAGVAAVLSAVTPVIRQQAAEEIAQAIHERFDHLHPEWHSNMIAVAEWCEDEARRRSHVRSNED